MSDKSAQNGAIDTAKLYRAKQAALRGHLYSAADAPVLPHQNAVASL
jgi:hypothetical protein